MVFCDLEMYLFSKSSMYTFFMVKPPGHLFAVSCLQRSEFAANMKLQKEGMGVCNLCDTPEKPIFTVQKSLKSNSILFICVCFCFLAVMSTRVISLLVQDRKTTWINIQSRRLDISLTSTQVVSLLVPGSLWWCLDIGLMSNIPSLLVQIAYGVV